MNQLKSSDPVESLHFVYANAKAEKKDVVLDRWRESGLYLQGFDVDGRWKTYRIDRIAAYPTGSDALLVDPFQVAPPLPAKINSIRTPGIRSYTGQPEILFTGFKKEVMPGSKFSERDVLEAAGVSAGFKVVKTVTKNLLYLVCGPTAGPSKIEKARAKRVFLLRKIDFETLVESGVLPDSECQRLGDMGRPDDFEQFALSVQSWAYTVGPQHIDAAFAMDFKEGDVYHSKSAAGHYLQVAYNTDDGRIEVHSGQEGVTGSRRGYLVDAEQMAYWLQIGRAPHGVDDVFRGTSKAGLLAWQLPDTNKSEA